MQRRLFPVLAVGLLALATAGPIGCKSETVEYYPRPDTGSDIGADSGDASTDTAADAPGDSGAEAQWAGLPCEENLDCGPAPRQCITRETLDGFGVNEDIQLPGGMCSRLLCQTDEDCGTNGTCFDASALGAPGIRICLATCEEIIDCRWEEGWDCIPMSLVQEGAEGGACVSDSLHVAIICDDGHCDDEEASE